MRSATEKAISGSPIEATRFNSTWSDENFSYERNGSSSSNVTFTASRNRANPDWVGPANNKQAPGVADAIRRKDRNVRSR
jgi:hypothetical protein